MLVGSFYRKYVRFLPLDQVPLDIRNDPKLYPYFKDCRGAIDGSQFNSWVQDEATVRCRNRKGFISQNVLAICDWDLQFLYILSGWEGSAADSRIFEYAAQKDLRLPRGYYFLVDAGFPTCDMLLTPYRGVRYHLKEWSRGNQRQCPCLFFRVFLPDNIYRRPQNHEELFNLRHASARNAVERIFGVFKCQFSVFKTAPEYPIDMQAMLVPALAAVHNFVGIHDRDQDNFTDQTNSTAPMRAGSAGTETQREPRVISEAELGFNVTAEEKQRANERRDRIARQMWVGYQAELRRRGE